MMIKNIKRAIVLGLASLMLFAGVPAPKVLAADNAPVHTEVKVSGANNSTVIYRIYLDKTKEQDSKLLATDKLFSATLITMNGTSHKREATAIPEEF